MRIKRLLFYATVSLFAIFLLWFVITNGKYMQMCNNKFLTLSLAGTSNKSLSLDIDVYDVTWGDTLSGISRLTGVSVDELAQLNHIANPNLIYSGSSIKIRQTP